ncbi:MAG: tetratricopeptide repeat protein, partial [Candidatus Omnitrophica bacterium]|nr:tetratricopeptide repeat protein [Candidatus Omnitrophota bacterium]
MPVLSVLGYRLLGWMARRATPDPRLRQIVLLSYGIRVGLGVCLFAISYWRWPFLRSLQSDRGFWLFGLDASSYHFFAREFVDAWNKGIELPDPVLGPEYFTVVAAVYKLFGVHPLYPIILNGLLAAATGLLAYLAGRMLFDHRAALMSAVLVGFWLSSLIWSAQLLKDSLSWVLIFLILHLILKAVSRETDARPWERRRWVGLCVALGVLMMLLTRLRFYLGSSFLAAVLVVFVPAAGHALIHQRVRTGLRYLMIVLVVTGSTLLARTFNTLALVSPRHPEIGHKKLAERYWKGGHLSDAEAEFYQAIAKNDRYKDAYLGLAAVQIQQGRLDAALKVYTAYLEREDPARRLLVKNIIARIYFETGNRDLDAGRVKEAIEAYEHALAFDLSSARTHMKLGVALAYQQQFQQAIAMLEKALALTPEAADQTLLRLQLASVYARKGESAFGRGRLDEAVFAYRQAMDLDPSTPSTYANLGQALAYQQQFQPAIAMLEKALALTPPGPTYEELKREHASLLALQASSSTTSLMTSVAH